MMGTAMKLASVRKARWRQRRRDGIVVRPLELHEVHDSRRLVLLGYLAANDIGNPEAITEAAQLLWNDVMNGALALRRVHA
jgi:hypothetical protein